MGCTKVATLLEELLEMSTDRKVSPHVVQRKTKAEAYPNTIGLPAGPIELGGSCADTTEFCEGCYAKKIEKYIPAAEKKVRRNYVKLRAVGENVPAIVRLLDASFSKWYVTTVKRGLPLNFRIHWDGDFYSVAYAQGWARICRAYPDVTFWAYTRARWAIPHLAGIPNLALYASVDEYNRAEWAETLAAYPQVKVAACAETFSAGETILLELGRKRAPRCPEGVPDANGKVRLPLVVTASGRGVPEPGETGQGACNACGYCLVGRGDIRFATDKKGT